MSWGKPQKQKEWWQLRAKRAEGDSFQCIECLQMIRKGEFFYSRGFCENIHVKHVRRPD